MFKKFLFLSLIFSAFIMLMPGLTNAALVGKWNFDEGSGTTAADSVGTQTGNITGTTSWVTGKIGGAIDLQSAGMFTVPGASFPTITNAFTLAYWAYGNASCATSLTVPFLMSSTPIAYGDLAPGNGHLYSGSWGEILTFAVNDSDLRGQWNHWAYEKDVTTGTMRVYINGQLRGEATGKVAPIDGTTSAPMEFSHATYPFDSKMDDLRVYDTALSKEEVQAIIAESSPLPSGATPIGKWNFDENSGTMAADSIGGQNATINGTFSWVPGKIGSAVDLQGTSNISVSSATFPSITDAFTLAYWANGNPSCGTSLTVTFLISYLPLVYGEIGPGFVRLYSGGWGEILSGSVTDADLRGQWNHWAYEKDASTGTMSIYINGQLRASALGKTLPINGAAASPMEISQSSFPFDTKIDDLRIYDIALSEADVMDIIAEATLTAIDPSPQNSKIGVVTPVILSWKKGANAASHQVYFGTDYNSVSTATTGYASTTEPNYNPGLLELEKTYYWRVDEVNGSTIWKGDVWNFTTFDGVYVDPNCEVWYKFNEGTGTICNDSTGNGFTGNLNGTYTWVAGNKGPFAMYRAETALDFDHTGGMTAPTNALFNCQTQVTFGMWLYGGDTLPNAEVVQLSWGGSGLISLICVPTGASNVQWLCGSDFVDQINYNVPNPDDYKGKWNHWAFTKNTVTGVMDVIHNGSVVATVSGMTRPLNSTGTASYYIGYDGSDVARWDGIIDDYRVYSRELSASEVAREWGLVDTTIAWQPTPADRASMQGLNQVLSWNAGSYAAETNGHQVYFGTNFEDVNSATTGYVTTTDPTYTPPALELGETYYWRVDEVNPSYPASPWKGNVWSFTTIPYLLVDDFESYASTSALEEVWVPSYLGENYVNLDTAFRAGGLKSLRLEAENNYQPYYLEGTVQTSNLPIGANWTQADIRAMRLTIHGHILNEVLQPIYVKLTDSSSNEATVYYDGNLNFEQFESWQPWRIWYIDLAEFSGVNLSNITSVAVGIGDGVNPANQMMRHTTYVDDIRLYPSHCTGDVNLGPMADFTSDCKVDSNDIRVMSQVWLEQPSTVTASIPSEDGLIGWWKFDEGSGTIAADSSTGGHDATLHATAGWVAGHVGSNAVHIDGVAFGTSDVEIAPAACASIDMECSVSFWANGDSDLMEIVTGAPTAFYVYGATGGVIVAGVPFQNDGLVMWVSADSFLNQISKYAEPADLKGQWNHWTFTKNANTGSMKIYLNGVLWHSGQGKTLPIKGDKAEKFTIGSYSNWYFYKGALDDVRLYNRELTAGEIVSLSGKTSVVQPLVGTAYRIDKALNNNHKIDFLDYAILANHWLENQKWP